MFSVAALLSVSLALACPPRVVTPVHGTVTDWYRPPPCTWCAGNRGWEIDVGAPYEVVSATDGVVTFSGSVARVAYIVVQTGCGLRITYGRIDEPVVLHRGDAVRQGELLGRSRTLFLGLRRGATRLDPNVLWGPRRARLVNPRAVVATTRRSGGP